MSKQAKLPADVVTTRRALLFSAAAPGCSVAEGLLSAVGFSTVERFDDAGFPSASTDRLGGFVPVIRLEATEGIRRIDRFHAQIVRFLRLGEPLVLVGGMDEIGFEQEQFDLIDGEYRDVLRGVGLTPAGIFPAPLGEDHEAGMEALGAAVDSLSIGARRGGGPLRIAVGSAAAADGGWRVRGRLVSGEVHRCDEILASPSNLSGSVAGINLKESLSDSDAGRPDIELVFGEPFFPETGEILSRHDDAPIETDVFRAHVRWTGPSISIGDTLQCATAYGRFEASVQSVDLILDPARQTIASGGHPESGHLAEIVLRTPGLVAIDSYETGHAAIQLRLAEKGGEAVAAGFISMDGYADQRALVTPKATNITPVQHVVSEEERRNRNGHGGGVLWFTGLSGSGKSTLAVALEARLFAQGYQVFVLDGDNVRQGLTSNLGFSPLDRSENIRRVGEVAALFRQAGVIVISSFISPYRSDRDRARHAARSAFHEIYIKADVETCIARDPKGLYKKALKGDIGDFTGISAPYEEPAAPELVVDTQKAGIEACVDLLINYVDRNFRV